MKDKNKGITLVALIITILVMLILVAVSTNVLIKSNLLGTAETTVDKYKATEEEEEKGGAITIDGKEYNSIDDYMEGKEKLPDIEAGKRAETKSNYKSATIPKGFTVSKIPEETTIDGGLVIYDIPEGTIVDWTKPDNIKTAYNQFVWIPVEVNKTTEPVDTETSISAFIRSSWKANDRTDGLDKTTYNEPDETNDAKDKTGIVKQIANLTASIYKYEGFYIGRYEAGSETPRTSSSGVTTLGIKQDMYPYIYVQWGDSMSSIGTTGAVYLSNNLYNTEEYGATSMLCTGACWDSMLDFIKDSKHNVTDSATWGNYLDSKTYKIYRGSLYSSSWSPADKTNGTDVTKDTSTLLTTGATERNCSKNIYDVAGNCYEWTTEAVLSVDRVTRGGRYNGPSMRSAGYRGDYNPGASHDYISFRPILYVAQQESRR